MGDLLDKMLCPLHSSSCPVQNAVSLDINERIQESKINVSLIIPGFIDFIVEFQSDRWHCVLSIMYHVLSITKLISMFMRESKNKN